MNFDYAGYLERRPDVCGGALVIKGTRVPVRTLLASLAEGATELFRTEDVAAWKGCFVVLSGHKLRVLRPVDG